MSGTLRGKLCDQFTGQRSVQRVAAGKCLYIAGDRAKSTYYMRKGLLRTSIVSENGKELILRVHQPSDVLGELCFCDGLRREQVLAIEDSEVVPIPFEALISGLQKNREALSEFIALISQYLAASYERLPIFFFHTPMERLVSTLLKLADELGAPFGDEIRVVHYFRQEDLAAMIGAPRQVVSSLLNQLRDLQLVSYHRRGSLTINKEAVKRYLRSINENSA